MTQGRVLICCEESLGLANVVSIYGHGDNYKLLAADLRRHLALALFYQFFLAKYFLYFIFKAP